MLCSTQGNKTDLRSSFAFQLLPVPSVNFWYLKKRKDKQPHKVQLVKKEAESEGGGGLLMGNRFRHQQKSLHFHSTGFFHFGLWRRGFPKGEGGERQESEETLFQGIGTPPQAFLLTLSNTSLGCWAHHPFTLSRRIPALAFLPPVTAHYEKTRRTRESELLPFKSPITSKHLESP